MRRGDDMHGRGGAEGMCGATFRRSYTCPDILVLVHRGRRSIRPKCASQFTPGAVRTTNQSQAPALARADAGEGLAAVTGGTALRASRHPTSAPRGSRGTGASAGETSKFIGTTRTSRVSTAWRESGGSPQAL